MNLFKKVYSDFRDSKENSFFLKKRHIYSIINGFSISGNSRGVVRFYNMFFAEWESLTSLLGSKKLSDLQRKNLEKAVKNIYPDKYILIKVSNLLAKAGETKELFKIWARLIILDLDIQSVMVNNMVLSLIKMGKIDQALWVSKISRSIDISYYKENKKTMSTINRDSSVAANSNISKSGLISPSQSDENSSYQPWEGKALISKAILLIGETVDNPRIINFSNDKEHNYINSLIEKLNVPPSYNITLYSILIQGAVSLGRFELAQKIYREMADLGLTPSKKTLAELVTMYADSKQIGKIKAILHRTLFSETKFQIIKAENRKNRMKSKRSRLDEDSLFIPLLYSYILNYQTKEAAMVLSAWNQLYNCEMPVYIVSSALIQIYRAIGMPDTGLKLANELGVLLDFKTQNVIESRSQVQSIASQSETDIDSLIKYYDQKLKASLESFNIPSCIGVFDEMLQKNVLPTYSMVILMLYGFIQLDSLEMFNILVDYYYDHIGPALPAQLYSFWISSLSRTGDPMAAYAVINSMVERGVKVGEIHYAMIIQGCIKNSMVREADKLVLDLQHPDSTVKPGWAIFTSLVELHVNSGDLEGAERILFSSLRDMQLPRKNLEARIFNYIIIGHLSLENIEKALRIFNIMRSLKVVPDKYTYASFIHSYSRLMEHNKVDSFFEQLIQSGIKLDAIIFTVLIGFYSTRGNIKAAEAIFKKAEQLNDEYLRKKIQTQSLKLSSATYPSKVTTVLNKMYLTGGDGIYENDFAELDSRLEPTDIGDSGPLVDPVMITVMIRAYMKAGDLDAVFLYWNRLIESYPLKKIDPKNPENRVVYVTSEFHTAGMNSVLYAHLKYIDKHKIFDKTMGVHSFNSYGTEMNNMYITEDITFNKAEFSQDKPETNNKKEEDSKGHTETALDKSKDPAGYMDRDKAQKSGSRRYGNQSLLKNREIINEAIERLIKEIDRVLEFQFFFDSEHVNTYVSCLLLTDKYSEVERFLDRFNPSGSNENPKKSEVQQNSYGYTINPGIASLRINEKNSDFLVYKVQCIYQICRILQEMMVKREKELRSRYNIVSFRSEWKGSVSFQTGNSGNRSENSKQIDAVNHTPTLEDFIKKDIGMFNLRMKHNMAVKEKEHLTDLLKIWSNFSSSPTIQSLANSISVSSDTFSAKT
ncbi:hypothetical protein BB560_002106 [Smittium megazygosporum]|uniref:PROP1-like PPR domain-containing protein n=1 Tax=Smittium megazygosporum TaxID=133381 RepID=A0A2T9ZFN5_9FUNG|nr:hypothetical protein BB560_002106 [Smittium megazygosporum]